MSENLITFEEGKKIQELVKQKSEIGVQIQNLDMALGGGEKGKSEIAKFIKS